MTEPVEKKSRERISREESELAARAARGDRAAFDRLFDRYFDRVAWTLRDLPEAEAKAVVWEVLEQIFVGLDSTDTPLATRAYRIACHSRATATRQRKTSSVAANREGPMRTHLVRVVASSLCLVFGVAASAADLDAEAVDLDLNAAKGNALIKVAVTDIHLIDADDAGPTPKPGEGHLHYQVDDGPVIATSAAKLAFHELKPGTHRIRVALVGNDHKPLGPEETVTVMIPSAVLAH